MVLCEIFLGLVAGLVFLFVILELHYFLRCLIYLILARATRKKIHILQETSITGICLLNDIDFNLTHMNNARFLRELDFAKVDFYERTDLHKCILKHGGSMAMGATTIRYRRFIKLFSKYVVKSKIVYWNENSIFMEHRFITPWNGFINAIVLCRIRLTKCSAEAIMTELLTNHPDRKTTEDVEKPELPLEVAKWIEYNDISSEKLRNAQAQEV